ncbi:MAG: mechanosensitive ion channel domain-containing protein [Myxococcota bacterium]|jgi:small-conductance mechanosensitive channel
MLPSLATGLAALAAAGTAQLLLRRARHRTKAWITRRKRSDLPVAPLRAASLALLVLQAASGLLALRIASTAHPALAALRERVGGVLMRALESPLFALSGRGVTALDLVLLPIAAFALWLAVNGATHLLRVSLLRALGLENGSEEAAAGLLRYGLLFVGALIALQGAGIDVRGLAIAGGVLGVGIGFGLQGLANNFVSGVVIGLERPIRPGDVVRVGEHFGTILTIGARATALRTLDRVTILIPNSRFLESEVVNWSHGDPVSRVHVPIGVDYASDVATVRAALLSAARAHPAVLREPRPQVQLRGFGGSSLDFELLVWTRDPKNQFTLVSDLNFRIEAELERHGVRVPFPQLDVHIHSSEPRSAADRLAAPAVHKDASLTALGHAPHPPIERSRDEKSPEEWTVAELERALARMRGDDGVVRADRRHWLRSYRDCFVGSEAVDWLMKHEALTRNEARALGERLTDLGWIRHVLDEHGFRDGGFYYRFATPKPRA